jgi:two-component system cell cycle response regulator
MKTKLIRILLIDDNPSDAMMLQNLLGKTGNSEYDVRVADSLSSGLNHISTTAFHIVFLDLNLPDSKSIDTYLAFRDQVPDLPVIVLTGIKDQEIAGRALREGAQDYLLKGKIDSDLLKRVICYSLERKKVELALRDANENLSQKVKQRTEKLEEEIKERKKAETELKIIQDGLKGKVADRVEELQETIDELNVQLEERQMMSEALHESEEQFRSLVANLPGAVYRCKIDKEWTLEFISEKIEEITGYPPSFFIQNRVRSYRSITHPDDYDKVKKAFQEDLDPMKSIHVEYRIIDANNNIRWFVEKGQAIFSHDGQPLWLDGAIFDDSERKFAEDALQEANKELQRLAIIDGLTQIPNRRRFDEHFENEWNRMKRDQKQLSLILCDIDFFKLYNDHYGHQEGDVCLQAVAQAIHQVAKRPADLAARYGGEEFVIILPDTDISGAFNIAQEVREKIVDLEILHEHSNTAKYVTLSLGVASTTPSQDILPEDLVKEADNALYQAKEYGRNCVFPWRSMAE